MILPLHEWMIARCDLALKLLWKAFRAPQWKSQIYFYALRSALAGPEALLQHGLEVFGKWQRLVFMSFYTIM